MVRPINASPAVPFRNLGGVGMRVVPVGHECFGHLRTGALSTVSSYSPLLFVRKLQGDSAILSIARSPLCLRVFSSTKVLKVLVKPITRALAAE